MDSAESRPAEMIAWIDPSETFEMNLRPGDGEGAKMTVTLRGNEVHVEGTDCVYQVSPKGALRDSDVTEKLLDEIELSLALHRCQITWRYREAK